jgi:hypothetical protein
VIVIFAVAVTDGQGPEAGIVFVTVYVPGVLADKFTCPVLVLTNTNPAEDVNVPAVPVNVGEGFAAF